MAYKFVEKRKQTQEETTYIIYMIISSYFHKTTCKNQVLLDRFYLYYQEMRDQISQERKVIKQVEHDLKDYSDVFSLMKCICTIEQIAGTYHMDFMTCFEHVHVEVDPNGKWNISVK